jgi:hypothetical protein
MNDITTGWPTEHDPARSPVFAHNESRTALSADRLWPVLIHAVFFIIWRTVAADRFVSDR